MCTTVEAGYTESATCFCSRLFYVRSLHSKVIWPIYARAVDHNWLKNAAMFECSLHEHNRVIAWSLVAAMTKFKMRIITTLPSRSHRVTAVTFRSTACALHHAVYFIDAKPLTAFDITKRCKCCRHCEIKSMSRVERRRCNELVQSQVA